MGAKTRNASSKKHVRKLPGFFSLSNKKFVVALVIVVAAAGFGSYQLYKNSAAAQVKRPGSVKWCKERGVILRRGSTGECVKSLQAVLTAARLKYGLSLDTIPYLGQPGSFDGIFGSQTEKAVRGYQSYRRIGSDGVVGQQTWGKLEIDCYNTMYSYSWADYACGYR